MKKNVTSQVIGAQLVSATDGSAFTGSVTCYVTGDGGTQAAGSVGSGACTHEGNGFHTYTPSQAETNYDHIAFTFTGTGAVPVTVQLYTEFPQTGDGYAIANNGTYGNSAVKTLIDTLTAYVDTEVAAIKAKTDSLTFTDAGKVDATIQAAADIKTAVANKISDFTLRRSLASALASSNGDTKDFRSLAGAVAKLVDKVAISGTTLTIYETDDSTALGTQTLTTDAAAEPITAADTV